MILISDNVSHDSRDMDPDHGRICSINKTIKSLNTIPLDIQEQIKLYYSVPSDLSVKCYSEETEEDYINPKTQLDTLLANSFNSLDSSVNKGGYLEWEFTGDSLIKTLPNMINEVAKSKMLCLTDKVTAKISDTVSVMYESNFEKEYKLFKENKESSLSITNTQIAEILKELKDSERFIESQQSCFDLVDLENNNFSKVITTKSTKIKYEFKE